jgi:hypothetical protein
VVFQISTRSSFGRQGAWQAGSEVTIRFLDPTFVLVVKGKRLKVLDFYIATLTKRPAPLYTVGRLQVRTAEESGAIIDGKPPLQPTTVVPVAARKDINPQPKLVPIYRPRKDGRLG